MLARIGPSPMSFCVFISDERTVDIQAPHIARL
jgi:hypothetical protein